LRAPPESWRIRFQTVLRGQYQCYGVVGAVQPCGGARQSKQSPGPESSIIKIFGSELLQSLNDLLIEAPAATRLRQTNHDRIRTVEVSASFLQVRRATIYGGSSEIQRNIVARRVLNLPN